MDVSKAISNFLRVKYSVGASHARELAAAFLGYKSHSAYLQETGKASWSLRDVNVLIPDLDRLEARLQTITGLPPLPSGRIIAKQIGKDLKEQSLFRGDVLIAKDIPEFRRLMESEYLRESISLEDELSGEIALTNAWFHWEHYQEVEVKTYGKGIIVEASGFFEGKNDDEADKPNHGDVIDFDVTVKFELAAWRAGFRKEVSVQGEVRPPY